MFRHFKTSCIVLFMGTILFGIMYPFFIWAIGHLFFPCQAEGSPMYVDGKLRGLQNVGQRFVSEDYFWGRPSEMHRCENGLIVSGASNLSWSSKKLRSVVESRISALAGASTGKVPNDLVMASASGIDPDISFEGAIFQIERVARARKIQEAELRALVCHLEEPTLLGLFPRRINVVKLNMELDRLHPRDCKDTPIQ